jgi:nucleoside triphosphate diphosphatase
MSAPAKAPGQSLEALLVLMARLRDPQSGCPWDRAQDFASIAPYTIEEAYEVAEAIAQGEPQALRDELGDLLFQVVFHAQMASERGWFDFSAVADGIRAKLERRHPHVFAAEPGTRATDDHAELNRQWEQHKAAERAAAGFGGVLAGVPLALPALTRAAKLGRRAGRVGFDWSDAASVRPKVDEELAEVESAQASGDAAALAEEVGDLLFAVANWARHLKVDPEAALRAANGKFERRFAAMERMASERGLDLATLDAAAWESLWQQAKAGGA